jgi:hypothetical protein
MRLRSYNEPRMGYALSCPHTEFISCADGVQTCVLQATLTGHTNNIPCIGAVTELMHNDFL